MKILFFSYLFPTSIALMIFLGSYYLLLRKGSLFQLNRFFLLSALVFSFVLPFVHFDNPAPVQQINYNTAIKKQITYNKPIAKINAPKESFDWNVFWKIIYLSGVVLMLAKMIIQLGKILFLVIKFGIKKEGSYSIVWMQNNLPHFSFFRLIFINKNKIGKDEEISSIILHEAAHIKQWHCIDLLLLEIGSVLQWFNPAMWMYRHSMKGIHEYLADQAVLKTGTEKIAYCQLLFKQTTGFQLESLTNSFNYPSLKNRIMMMTQKQNHRRNIVKLCFALPLFVLLISVFAYASNPESKPKFNAEDYKTSPDQTAVYKNGEQDLTAYFLSALGKDWKQTMTEQTTIKLKLYIDETGKVASVSTLWNYMSLDKEIDFYTWFRKMDAWKPAMKDGKPIKSTFIYDGSSALMTEAKRRGFTIYTVEEFEKKIKKDEEKAKKENPFNTIPDQPAICTGGEQALIEAFFSAIDFDKWKSQVSEKTNIQFRLSIDEKGKVAGVGTEYNSIGLFANTKDEFEFSKQFEKMKNWKPAIKDGKALKSVYIFEAGDILRAELQRRGLKIYTEQELKEAAEKYKW